MKRLKVTKNGKIIARKPGQNHFNAKESGAKQMTGSRMQAFAVTPKVSQRFITTASKSKN